MLGGTIKQPMGDFDVSHGERNYALSQDEVIQGKQIDIMLWLMFYGDGKHSLLDISEKIHFNVESLFKIAQLLCSHGLLEEA